MSEGPLDRPIFGEPSPPHRAGRIARVRFPYKSLLEMVREHPKRWAKIATFTKGTRKQTAAKAAYAKGRCRNYLETKYPLERWTVAIRTTPDTWGDRELWVRLEGTWTAEEAAADKKRRSEEWTRRQDLVAANKARRIAAAKMRAMKAAEDQRRERGAAGE